MIAMRSSLLCSCLSAVLLAAVHLPADELKYVSSDPPQGANDDGRLEDEVGTAYYVYEDRSPDHHASGWMPGGDIALAQTLESTEAPRRGKHCYKAECDLKTDPWMGVAWLLGGTWTPKKKLDLLEKIGAKKGDPVVLRFWAKSPGRATVQFMVGAAPEDSVILAYESGWLKLAPDWTRHQIDLTGADLSGSVCPFLWVVDREHSGKGKVVLFLDDVYLTKLKAPPKK